MDNSRVYAIRRKYGNVFVSIFDNIIVPWKTLSIQDYIQYDEDLRRGIVPSAFIEDEIFRKCVVDQSIVRQMDHLYAGTVTTVVRNIWDYSGPNSTEGLNQDLETTRSLVHNSPSKIFHQFVQVIISAFPAYKPEDVYAMPYNTFLMRLVEAEMRLMNAGVLTEPLTVLQEGQELGGKKKRPKRGPRPSDANNTVDPRVLDAKSLWESQQQGADKKEQQPAINPSPIPQAHEKWWDKSPVLEAPQKHGMDLALEGLETNTFVLQGHEKVDLDINRAKMIEDAKVIYKDLIAELDKRRKK